MPSTSEVVDKAKKMVAQTSAEGSKEFSGSSFDTPISSSSLTPQPEIKLEQPKPGTEVAGMLGEIGSSTDAFTEGLTQRRESAEKAMTDTKGTYQEFLNSLRGGTQLTSEAYDAGGVNVAEQELNKINQQIRNEQRALQNRVRTIQERGGGLAGGMQAEISNIERESLRKQADLYVIQQGVQGQYDSAKAIADRAVSAYLEKQGIELEALKFGYEENKDLFTEAEQREFDVMFEDRKRALDRQETDMKAISDLSLDALQNGAPPELASQMRQAKTPQEAMEIGGQYIGALDRRRLALSQANADLERKAMLLELAKAGDRDSMIELGLDPDAPQIGEKIKVQEQVTKIDEEMNRINAMLTNTTGLETASGVVRSPFLTSLGVSVPGGVATGAGVGSVVPGLGTAVGTGLGLIAGTATGVYQYSKQKDAQADFLAKANYVLTNLTTEKVKQLKAEGVAFTPMTDKDVDLIGRTVGEIEGYAIRDERGRVVGFTSEEGVRDALGQILTTMQESKEREYRKIMSEEELAEIEKQ